MPERLLIGPGRHPASILSTRSCRLRLNHADFQAMEAWFKSGLRPGWLGSTPRATPPDPAALPRWGAQLAVASSIPATQLSSPAQLAERVITPHAPMTLGASHVSRHQTGMTLPLLVIFGWATGPPAGVGDGLRFIPLHTLTTLLSALGAFCLWEFRVFSTNLNILRFICSGYGDPAHGAAATAAPDGSLRSYPRPTLQRPVASEDEASECSELHSVVTRKRPSLKRAPFRRRVDGCVLRAKYTMVRISIDVPVCGKMQRTSLRAPDRGTGRGTRGSGSAWPVRVRFGSERHRLFLSTVRCIGSLLDC